MGRKALYNEQEVFQAADSLASEGREVTAMALLGALGGGSLTTIYKHLEAWRESRPAATGTGMAVEIPDLVQGAFSAAWRTAVTEAGREITTVRERAADEIKAAQRQFQEAKASIELLEAESEVDAGKIEELTAKIQELESSVRKAENERAALTATVEQQGERIKTVESELERVHQEGNAERIRHQTEVERLRNEFDGERKRSQEELLRSNKSVEASKTEMEGLREALAEAQRDRERGEFGKSEAEKRAEKAENQLERTQKERETAVKEAASLGGQIEAIKSQNADLLSRLTPPKGR